jgi:hypothetical protein
MPCDRKVTSAKLITPTLAALELLHHSEQPDDECPLRADSVTRNASGLEGFQR